MGLADRVLVGVREDEGVPVFVLDPVRLWVPVGVSVLVPVDVGVSVEVADRLGDAVRDEVEDGLAVIDAVGELLIVEVGE